MKNKIAIIVIVFSAICQAQSFKGSFDLKISQESNNGNQHIETVSYFFGEEKTAIIMHAGGNQPDLRLVFNPADSIISGLFEMNGKKGGYILPMNEKYWPTMKYALGEKDVLSNSEVNYTENKKEINGYNTKEVSCSNDKMEATFWIAEEIELSLTQVMAYQFVGSGKEGEDIKMLADCGIMKLALNTNLFDKQRNSNIVLEIENFSTEIDSEVFNTNDYELSDMRKPK
ncbi:MAG: hypothetical protein KDC78_12805 [Aequorivita sp.]|nr:hypothetical protein [Aequorivita sp.]